MIKALDYSAFFCNIFFFLTYSFLGDEMTFKIGDYVTRDSYNNDIVFVIIGIKDNQAILKGYDLRLIANSPLSDLRICSEEDRQDEFLEEVNKEIEFDKLDRCSNEDFFYLPPKILHLDGDKDYLEKCLDYYKKNRIMAFGLICFNSAIDIMPKSI